MTNQPAIAAPTSCPFCKGRIPDDLVQFGGNCPHCLLEIPGEEAPTDPGLLARKKLEAEAIVKAKQVRGRRTLQGVVAVLLLGAVGGWAIWSAQQDRAARTYELPDDLYLPPLQEASAPGVNPMPEAPEVPGTPGGRKPVPTASNPLASNTAPLAALDGLGAEPPPGQGPDARAVSVAPGVNTSATAMPSTTQVAAGPAAAGPKRSSGMPAADVSVAVVTATGPTVDVEDVLRSRSGDEVLSDDDEIFAMIKTVMGKYQPQVRACYEGRLKQNENLAGAWKVSFVVRKDGSTASVAITPEGRRDTGLEGCISKTIDTWRFSRIAHDQPVSQTKRFGAAL